MCDREERWDRIKEISVVDISSHDDGKNCEISSLRGCSVDFFVAVNKQITDKMQNLFI